MKLINCRNAWKNTVVKTPKTDSYRALMIKQQQAAADGRKRAEANKKAQEKARREAAATGKVPSVKRVEKSRITLPKLKFMDKPDDNENL